MKSFKQFMVEYITDPLIHFRDFINMSDKDKGIDLAYMFSNYIEDYYAEMEVEYDYEGEEIEREMPETTDDMDGEEIELFGEWLFDRADEIAEKMGFGEMPSWYFMGYAEVVNNTWLCHVTDNASDIIYDGFNRGIEKMSELGLTTYMSDHYKKHETSDIFYGFAFTPKDIGMYWDGHKYGKDVVMFRSSGVRVTHHGDNEEQTLFIPKEARDFIPIYNRDGDYTIDDRSGRTIYRNSKIDDVVAWVIQNFPQYKSSIVQRERNF